MVLNGKGDLHKINTETQRRVLETAEKYNYRPNQIARNLSKGNSMTLGLIVPNISDSYFSSAAYHFEDLAREVNYKVLLGSSREDDKKEIELLTTFYDNQVDGILIASTQQNLPTIKKMYDGGLPIVLFDRIYEGTNLPAVRLDNYNGVRQLVKELKTAGKKKIGYIGVDLDLLTLHERRKGFTDEIEPNMASKSQLEIIHYATHKSECGDAIDKLIDEVKCDAIVFETQYLTLLGIKHMTDRKINGKKEVTLSSYGNHAVFDLFDTKINSVDLNIHETIKSAFDMLFKMINKDAENNLSDLLLTIEPKLIKRH